MSGTQDAELSVTTRSVRFDSVVAGDLRVTHARYPALRSVAHWHRRVVCSVLLEGVWEQVIAGQASTGARGTLLAKPPGASHVDRLEDGARLVVIEIEPDAEERLGAFSRLVRQPVRVCGPAVFGLAWRIGSELDTPDSFTATVVEGLALELIGVSGRELATRSSGRAPVWLERARELMHATFRAAPQVQEIAHAVDVHPVLLARAFRAHLGTSPGRYLRRVRLEWAAAELVAADRPIADIAVDAGFADQSHFTRTFRRHMGLTPGQYRLAFIAGRSAPT